MGVVLAQEEEHKFLVSQGKKYNDRIIFLLFFCVFVRYLRVWMKKSKYYVGFEGSTWPASGQHLCTRMLLSIAKSISKLFFYYNSFDTASNVLFLIFEFFIFFPRSL